MRPPNSRERQVMQHLRGAGWVNVTRLPDSPRTIAKLTVKGWVECQRTESGQAYRLTDLGLQVMKVPLPIRPSQNQAEAGRRLVEFGLKAKQK
jgi:hypothetical protein